MDDTKVQTACCILSSISFRTGGDLKRHLPVGEAARYMASLSAGQPAAKKLGEPEGNVKSSKVPTS